MQHRRLLLPLIGVALAALAVGACSSNNKSSSASTGAGENTFGLREFTITPPTNPLHAGHVTITAKNVGGEVHELVIVRASTAGNLQTKPDGSVDEDRIAAADKVGEIEDVAARSSKSDTLNLTPGRYVAFCNIIDNMMGAGSGMMNGGPGMMGGSGMGHVHFAAGMHAPFSVA